MTVSVLMSVYKSESPSYFNTAIKSIWTSQTRKPDKIVVVEDGALGNELLNIIELWKEEIGEDLIVIKNEQNLGLTKSLNKGIAQIKTDLIARMDSDDISDPMRFERQLDFLERHPEVDIIGGALQEFNESNGCLRVRHYPETDSEAREYICKASPLAHPTVMMRRRIFDNGLRYNEKYRTSQDIALWFDALEAGFRIANLPEVTLLFRSEEAVFKRRSREKAWNEFKIYLNGIYRMDGLFTLKYRYPLARLCFRLMPPTIVKWVYQSKFRSKLLEKHNSKSC